MKSIRGGRGLGDAIYVAGVVRHLLARGEALDICTDFPDVYRQMQGRLRFSAYRRRPADIVAHYTTRRHMPGSSQFDDCCVTAGLPHGLEFRLDWKPVNLDLLERLKSTGKPIIAVQMPRAPFGRDDGYGVEFLPDVYTIQRAIDVLRGRAFVVQIGQGKPERFDGQRLMPFEGYHGIDLDLANRTSVCDVMDIGFAAHGFLGQCSFIIPLAECFAKPVLLVWSRRGLKSSHEVVRQMTPQKILHRPTSRAVIDDCSDQELRVSINALCEQVGSALAA